MTILNIWRSRPAPTVAMPASERLVGGGIRDQLRDTALLVTSLGAGGTVENATELRDRCLQMISTFSDALVRRGYPSDVRQEALVAQCGLLDEAALRHLPPESRPSWELTPLQVEKFKVHDAGEQVIEHLEARLRESTANVDLLECYAAILGMGFMGRYARDGQARRAHVIEALNAQLAKLRPPSEQSFISDHAGRRVSDWFYRLSPWAIAGLACVIALIVWSVCSVGLNAQIAHIVSAKVVQP